MKNLKNKLSIIERCVVINYDIIGKVYDYVCSNPLSVISKEWLDFKYKKKEPNHWELDDKEFDITYKYYWITEDANRTGYFYLNNDKLFVNIQVGYNTNFYKNRSYDEFNKRFKATIELPDSFLEVIEEEIILDLKYHFEKEYQKMLKQKEIDWINEQIKNL